MQAMNKIEQQQQQQQKPTFQKLQVEVNVMKKLMEELERGKKSTLMIRSLILQNYPRMKVEDFCKNNNDDHHDYYKALDHHSMVAIDTYLNSISMLKSCDFDGDFIEKRQLNYHLDHLNVISLDDLCKSEVSANQESPTKSSFVHGRRECYKKRKIGGESREEEVSHLTDDGFAWRKYGQKVIHNYHHPRHYYRCTHKHDQKCQATKQIQQVQENPTKYKLIYHGNHTCNNNFIKTSPYMIDSPEEHSSTIVLSFDGSNPVNHLLFPESTFPTTVVDAKDMMQKTIGSSSNQVSEQSEHISSVEVAENYSSTNSVNLEEDYSLIMANFSDELFSDWWTF